MDSRARCEALKATSIEKDGRIGEGGCLAHFRKKEYNRFRGFADARSSNNTTEVLFAGAML